VTNVNEDDACKIITNNKVGLINDSDNIEREAIIKK